MKRTRWKRVQVLFHEAAERPASERLAFLETRCGDDRALIADVLALLDEDARDDSLLARGVAQVAHRMLDTSARPAPPAAIGRYRIREVLGEGGMGVVYLAERDDLGGLVAVKVLRDAWVSPSRRERFINEQRTLAQLGHPSIARIYDADVLTDGTPWFAMEYVQGSPITEYCARHACSISERLRLLRQVAEAVQHIHQHLIIHRDLKPSNILVADDGTVKVLDFGIAKQLEGLDLPAVNTGAGLRLMTPAYAAPERLGADHVGLHMDVYSIGVILYELLTLRLPFDLTALSAPEAQRLILEHAPVKPSALARVTMIDARGSRTCWDDIDVLCATAMHKDPARRYRTAEALIRDIDHYLKGEPLEARPDTLGYRVGKFVRRNRGQVVAAALVLAGVIGLVAFYTVRLAAARDAALAEALRTQRIQRFTLRLFDGGDEEAGPAADVRVSTLADRGLLEARSLDREPEVQAALYLTLGGIYQKLGQLDRADELLQLALRERRSLLGAEHPSVASSLVALGLLRMEQARYEDAEALIREGLALTGRALRPDDSAHGHAMLALGKVLAARGAYEQAIEVLEDVVRVHGGADATTPEPDLIAGMHELATVHFYAGRYGQSEMLNQQVLAMNRQRHGDRHPNVAGSLIDLGAIQFEQGHYVEAERYYRLALDINEAWFGDDHHETAANLTMLGRALVYQQRNDEAVEPLRRALAIRERVYGPAHPAVASTLNELGNIAVAQGRFADAEARFGRMLEIYLTVYGGKHYLIGVAQANLGSVYMNQGDDARAEPLFRDAIRTYELTLPADHVNIGITRIKLGRALLRQSRHAEAEGHTRAGYEILTGQTDPSVSFLRAARNDLVAIYDVLDQPAMAARFRAELTEMEAVARADPDR